MKRVGIIFIGLILCLSSTRVSAYEPKITKHVMEENGLTIVIQEMPNNPMVSVYMLIKTGSATEGKYLGSGLTHFLEHMLFKGTEKRGVGVIPAEIQAVGGNLNASTSMDFTIYTLNVPYEAFDVALDVQADMLMNSILDPAEVEKEREVIFSEMRMINDRPSRYLSRMGFQTVYTKHPYRHPIIGYRDLLAQISRDELMDYYKSKYIPNNMVLAVAGNIKAEEVLPKIIETYKDYARKPYLTRTTPEEPEQVTPRRYEETFETNITHLSIAYPTVSMLDRDLYALDVLAQILGQGQSSRLHVDLYKQQKIVQSVRASNYTPVDKGVFEVEATMEDGSKVDEVIEETVGHIDSIKINGVTQEELDKSKKQVSSDYIFGNQTTQRVAWYLAYDEAFTGDYNFSSNYVKGVDQVTNEDIIRVAKKYLIPDAQSIMVLKPKEKGDVESIEQTTVAMQEIQKDTLANGLTVLTRVDPMFELVSIRLKLRGGIYEEPEGLNGLSSLMSTVWIKETKSRSAENLAEFVDSNGIRLNFSSGNTSIGIHMDCLSKDWVVCMDLLKEFVDEPEFPQEEIDLKKQQVQVYLKRRDKNIFSLSHFKLRQTLFDQHPIRREVSGTEESIEKITRKDVIKFYKKLLKPSNMVISVFGNIDPLAVKARIIEDYGDMKVSDIAFGEYEPIPLPESKHLDVTLDKEQAMVLFGFRGVGFKHEDYYKLDVLASILGSSFSGRLFTNIRDKFGKAYTLGGNSVPSIDAGYVYFYVLTGDDSVAEVDKLLRDEIKTIQTEDVGEKELEDIKRYMKGSHKASLQTNSSLNSTASINELYELGYNYHQEYDKEIDQVTIKDIKEMANTYLDLNKVVSVYVRPPTKE